MNKKKVIPRNIKNLDMILDSIEEERTKHPESMIIEIIFSNSSGFLFNNLDSIQSTLETLQNVFKVIDRLNIKRTKEQDTELYSDFVVPSSQNLSPLKAFKLDSPLNLESDKLYTHLPPEKLTAKFLVLRCFDNWRLSYLLSINTTYSELSKLNFLKILSMTLDIEEQLQINPSTLVKVDLKTRHNLIDPEDKSLKYIYFHNERVNALSFLIKKEVIDSFKYEQFGDISGDFYINLNIFAFSEFKESILKYHNETYLGNKASSVNFPPDTSWEDIQINFLNEEIVNITIKNKTHKASFKKMCFEDRRNGAPNRQWLFLYYLAKSNGQISWKDTTARMDVTKKKQLLSKALKEYFKIPDDPFFPYKNEKSYTIKIQLSAN